MADIIDFAFYRKFRIILPVRPQKAAKAKLYDDVERSPRPYRRRRRLEETKSKTQQKDKSKR